MEYTNYRSVKIKVNTSTYRQRFCMGDFQMFTEGGRYWDTHVPYPNQGSPHSSSTSHFPVTACDGGGAGSGHGPVLGFLKGDLDCTPGSTVAQH